jgi:molybdenum cofactor cytidylyltransferase/probable selenium-dependent hydroxylase accessory protein YqeC
MISAIVLAAGESRRMGRTKLILDWRGKPILQHVLDALGDSSAGEVILVLGHEAEAIREKIEAPKVKIVINRDYREGMSTSLRQGILAADPRAQAFVVVLADQPGINPKIIDVLILNFRQAFPGKNVVVPVYKGRRGHPVLFGAKYREEILGLKGDVGGREILAGHPEDILSLEMDTDALLVDIDTPQDYERHLRSSASHKSMNLEEAFSLRDREVLSLVGGGGKTTLLLALADELSRGRKGVIVTTTTKIWEPAASPSFSLFCSPEIALIKKWVIENLGRVSYLVIARQKLSEGKLQGIPPAWVEELETLPGISFVIVEADGAAGRSLKAPREGEPVLPADSSILVPVVGMDALGCPLDDEHVFRADLAARLLGVDPGIEITEGIIARLLVYVLRDKPLEARVIPFLNKVDLPGCLEKGRNLARHLLSFKPLDIQRAVLGHARRFPRVREIFEKP